MNRGYFGIGAVNMKNNLNYGTLFRSAFNFHADFIFLIGKRFKRQASDTLNTDDHIPLYEYRTPEEFLNNRPHNCPLVSIEIADNSISLPKFSHPERAIYLLGPEDGNILPELIEHSNATVNIPTDDCMNVSVAGSIVMYDRILKRG